MHEREGSIELDVQKLFSEYLHNWWIILTCAIVGMLITWYITANFITPKYAASVTIYVNNTSREQYVETISSSSMTTSRQLVDTYINIIKSDTVMDAVSLFLDKSFSATHIRGMMEASQVGETELFKVTITHNDPELAARIANAIASVAPSKIEDFVSGSSTKIIDYAKIPTSPSSPNIGRNCIIGLVFGAAVAMLFIMAKMLLDVRIKGEEDLNALFELPVLAQIPVFANDNEKRRGYGRYGTYRRYGGYKKYGYGKGYGYTASAYEQQKEDK